MSKCVDVLCAIEKMASFDYACDWDNVGLLVGDKEQKVKKAIICIDNDINVVAEAVNSDADLIISHHPIMFSPIKRLTEDTPEQRLIRRMCESEISHIAAHTNVDSARGGLNDYLTKKLGFENGFIIEQTNIHAGFGRFVRVDEMTLADLINICKEKLGIEHVKYVGDLDKKITTAAINCGSGADILERAIFMGADVLITGDVKYTTARIAQDNDIAIIDAGHYETEIIFKEMMKKYLESEIDDVEFILSEADAPVLKYN